MFPDENNGRPAPDLRSDHAHADTAHSGRDAVRRSFGLLHAGEQATRFGDDGAFEPAGGCPQVSMKGRQALT